MARDGDKRTLKPWMKHSRRVFRVIFASLESSFSSPSVFFLAAFRESESFGASALRCDK